MTFLYYESLIFATDTGNLDKQEISEYMRYLPSQKPLPDINCIIFNADKPPHDQVQTHVLWPA